MGFSVVGMLVIGQYCNDYFITSMIPLDLDPATLEASGMLMEEGMPMKECGRVQKSHMAEYTPIMKLVNSISRNDLSLHNNTLKRNTFKTFILHFTNVFYE